MPDTENIELSNAAETMAKWNLQDSVFTHLFKEKPYTLQLYQALHPDDRNTTEDDIALVTLENVLLNQPFNDLGFTVGGDKLLILVEAQSTWSVNIVVRGLLYMADTLQQHIVDTRQNVYGTKPVSIPEVEFYVLYTGNRTERPAYLTLSEEFFGGRKTAIDVTVKMLYDGTQGDIINQYVTFTRISQEQIKLHGRSRKAILETIRICRDQNVLQSYLETREKEVVDIMMTLYNKEQVVSAFLYQERQDAQEEAIKKFVLNLHDMGMDEDFISRAAKISVDAVRKLLGMMPT